MKLCAFDFDSTLMDGETIDLIASAHAKSEEVSAITREAMNGKLDFFEALTRRVMLLKGMRCDRVREVCENLPLMNGAIETIAELKRRGYTVIILSGGFHEATSHAAKTLKTDAEFANYLHAKDNALTGYVGGEMMFGSSKGQMLSRIQRLLSVLPADTVAIGDGANDRSMFQHAAIRVAFCAKEALKKEANVIVEEKDLTQILKAI
ncbi:MAG: phosphoserine phosphatase SerB [Helicobacteraceae bacterium]|jgi:phosphoserine phosphatase|nr:phosphoserine phosphatase SerB [Helicobacteraceae bacterium]